MVFAIKENFAKRYWEYVIATVCTEHPTCRQSALSSEQMLPACQIPLHKMKVCCLHFPICLTNYCWFCRNPEPLSENKSHLHNLKCRLL